MNTLLQVRQSARALGVHENTLRRWEEQGYIRAVRLPSGVRRFRSEDVDALHKRIYDDQLPIDTGEDLVSVKAQPID